MRQGPGRFLAAAVCLLLASCVAPAGAGAWALRGPADLTGGLYRGCLLAVSVDTLCVYAGPGPLRLVAAPAAGDRETKGGEGRAGQSRRSKTGDSPLRLMPVGETYVRSEPGSIMSARVVAANAGGRPLTVRENIRSPSGWTRVASVGPEFVLNPDEQAVRLFTFHVPPDCPAGDYEIVYEAFDAGDPSVRAATDFQLTVLPQLELRSRVTMAPRTVVAGAEFTVEVALENKGNTGATARVSAAVRPDYDFRVEPDNVPLASGESRTVGIRVRTEGATEQRTLCLVSLRAGISDETGRVYSTEEVVTVDIIPRVTRLTDPYYRLPSWVRVALAADGRDAAGQIEISGSGNIGGDKGRNVSYVVRQASEPGIGRYGSWSERWAAYRGEHLEIDLGDRVFSLSPLVQRFNYARGAGARLKEDPIAAGAYYAAERTGEPDRREIAGFASYRLRSDLSLKANFMSRRCDSQTGGRGPAHSVGSLQAHYRRGPDAEVEIEFGAGTEGGGGNRGYRLEAGGVAAGRFYYSLEAVHAGPHFRGYYNDSDFMLGTLQVPLKPGTALRFSYRRYAANLDLDPEKLTANREHNVMAGLSYMLKPSTRLLVDLQSFSRRDRLGRPEYDFGERTIKLSFGYSISKYSLYLTAEQGYFHDDLNGRSCGLGRYSLSASMRPNQRHSYNIYGRLGHSKYAEEPSRSDNVGVAGRWRIGKNLDMHLDYHMSGSPSLVDNTYRILTHSLDYTLPNRHILGLRTSLWGARNGGGSDITVLLSYSVPVPVPLGRKKSVGTIKGRVFDSEDPDGAPVADVIITADGAAAVTDQSGRFEFPSLEPGVYSLQVDAKSIGLGRVTRGESPFSVIVEGGKTSRVEIGVVRSSSISGRVLISGMEAGTGEDSVLVGLGKGREAPRDARGLPDVLVEITDGRRCLTQYTASNGGFSFPGLRPGRWSVRIYPEDLPHYYYVETREAEAELAPGDAGSLTFRILPRRRHINIMDEGKIEMERP
jgi:hypothetical protein